MKAIVPVLLRTIVTPAWADAALPAPAAQPYVYDANRRLATQPPETDREKAAREQIREQAKAKKPG